MIAAFSYARVSSREQEREGYSIPAQRKLLAEYGRTRGSPSSASFRRWQRQMSQWSAGSPRPALEATEI